MDLAFALSLVLGAAGITGIWLAGRGHWQGWALGLAIQPVWAVFAIVTKGYGLLIICFGYGWVYLKNLLAWRRDQIIDACDPHPNAYTWYQKVRGVQYVKRCPDCKKAWPLEHQPV